MILIRRLGDGRWAAVLLLLALALPATAELYEWTDDEGRVHYSNQPRPGSEKVELAPLALDPVAAEDETPTDATRRDRLKRQRADRQLDSQDELPTQAPNPVWTEPEGSGDARPLPRHPTPRPSASASANDSTACPAFATRPGSRRAKSPAASARAARNARRTRTPSRIRRPREAPRSPGRPRKTPGPSARIRISRPTSRTSPTDRDVAMAKPRLGRELSRERGLPEQLSLIANPSRIQQSVGATKPTSFRAIA